VPGIQKKIMNKFFYFITVMLLVAWVADLFSTNTGNIMAIGAVMLSKFTESSSLRIAV
jgi:hypothetical protein